MEQIAPELQGIPETMLLTVYAKAAYSQKKGKYFYDQKSIDIAKSLKYDFAAASKDIAMNSGTIGRTILLDQMVKDYIAKNPTATIINAACGLDSRFYRVDNGKIHWYDVDLPESITIRKQFFKENDRVKMITASILDDSWPCAIPTVTGPLLIIVEGFSMYLIQDQIALLFKIIDHHFTHADIFFEIMPLFWLKHQQIEKSVMATSVRFHWGVDSGKQMTPYLGSISWVKDVPFTKTMCKLYPAMILGAWIPQVNHIAEKIAVLKK